MWRPFCLVFWKGVISYGGQLGTDVPNMACMAQGRADRATTGRTVGGAWPCETAECIGAAFTSFHNRRPINQ